MLQHWYLNAKRCCICGEVYLRGGWHFLWRSGVRVMRGRGRGGEERGGWRQCEDLQEPMSVLSSFKWTATKRARHVTEIEVISNGSHACRVWATEERTHTLFKATLKHTHVIYWFPYSGKIQSHLNLCTEAVFMYTCLICKDWTTRYCGMSCMGFYRHSHRMLNIKVVTQLWMT